MKLRGQGRGWGRESLAPEHSVLTPALDSEVIFGSAFKQCPSVTLKRHSTCRLRPSDARSWGIISKSHNGLQGAHITGSPMRSQDRRGLCVGLAAQVGGGFGSEAGLSHRVEKSTPKTEPTARPQSLEVPTSS